MLKKVGKEICHHVCHKGGSHGTGDKHRALFSSRFARRSGLEAANGAIEQGSRGSVEQHGFRFSFSGKQKNAKAVVSLGTESFYENFKRVGCANTC
jgi:hypothetical protein